MHASDFSKSLLSLLNLLRLLPGEEAKINCSYAETLLFVRLKSCSPQVEVKSKVCSLLEWCFIISIDTCWDWFQRRYVLITAQKNLPLLMLPLEAIVMPHLLKLISTLIAFDRLVYWEIQLIALTLMTSSKARAPELRMITRDSY